MFLKKLATVLFMKTGLSKKRIDRCLPKRLHPFSLQMLNSYLEGTVDTGEFLRWFHMPNSDYLDAGFCVAGVVDPEYDPYLDQSTRPRTNI